MNILLHVTHLLGSGHLSRTLTLARAFAAAGHRTVVLSGGMPAPHLDSRGVELVQLAPLRSDGTNFSRLLDAKGALATPQLLAERRALAVQTAQSLRPDAVITELFPFGRKGLAAEFVALAEAARAMVPRPMVLSSIRDILAPPRKPGKQERAEAHVTALYDGVLVHSDPHVIALEHSWPVSPNLAAKLHYTGFVAPEAPEPDPRLPQGEIVVSAGGGSVGRPVFEAARAAAGVASAQPWRLLVGGAHSEDLIAHLRQGAPGHCVIEPARSDYRQLMLGAACSVSLCGYNTALDVLQARARAVFVPFDEGSEVEQGLRARGLAARDEIHVLRASDLTEHSLLQAIEKVMAVPRPATLEIDMQGAARSVQIVHDLVNRRV